MVHDRVRLHVESGREKRRVQLRGGIAGANSGEETSGGFWGRSGHSAVGEEDHIGALPAVRYGFSAGSGGPKASQLPTDRCHSHVQDCYDLRPG